MLLKGDQVRENEIGHGQSANKEANDSNQRWQLQVTQARNGMSGRTSSGVAGSKTDQKASDYYENEALQAQERIPIEDIGRHDLLPGVFNTHFLEFRNGCLRNVDVVGGHQVLMGKKATDNKSGGKDQVPNLGFPVEIEEFAGISGS